MDGISRDRVSDIACNFLKSFLVDYTVEQCLKLNIPHQKVRLMSLYDYKEQFFRPDVEVELPINPATGSPIIFVPKRWLRHVPWINFDDYFATACPKDDVINRQGTDERVQVLLYNRSNHGAMLAHYVEVKERNADDCKNDPLFKQLPVISARRKLSEIKKLPSGTEDKADKKYEDAMAQLLSSLLYPHLDFVMQSRSEGGATIRDLVFYNNRSVDFLEDIIKDYNSRQLVMEMKNVRSIGRDHINQLNRYLVNEFGTFGVSVTHKSSRPSQCSRTQLNFGLLRGDGLLKFTDG